MQHPSDTPPWRPAGTPPSTLAMEPCALEAQSEPVLVITQSDRGYLRQMVATYRIDPDEPGAPRWVSECTECWVLHDVVLWRPLDWPPGLRP